LDDGENTYTYGLGRISQTNTESEYFLGDALGSIRQLTNNIGEITLAKNYSPYGEVITSAGNSESPFAYTGEQTDSTGLTYLRARYYNSNDGRFMSRDTWNGNYNSPLSLNRWNYTHSNPVNYTDPSGNNIYSGICMGQVLFKPIKSMPGGLLNMSAQRLVDLCKTFYSQGGFWQNYGVPGLGPYNCNELSKIAWNKPTTVNELFGDYICERGESDHFYFNGNDALTHKLARSLAIHNVRLEFYKNGNVPFHEEKFGGILQYLLEWNDLRVDSGFPIMHIMGSFNISVMDAGNNRVRFHVENRTDLASGTHFIGRFPPEGQEENPLSLEKFIAGNSVLQNQSAASVLSDESIVSVLKPQRRDETTNGMGGGNLYQTYSWTEDNLQFCNTFLLWPFYLDQINIGN
jgi:RHS repeat-associated protein